MIAVRPFVALAAVLGLAGIVAEGSVVIRAGAQEVRVVVSEKGYNPAKLMVRAGQVTRLTFVRTTPKTCVAEVVFPSLHIRRSLPVNKPVVVEFTPSAAGEIDFACGMDMFHGTVVVQ